MKTVARRDGDVYRINGEKMFASIANETDVGVLFAKTDREAGARGVTGFIVEPKKYPGWKAQPIEMLGLSNAFRTNVLSLDDFVVPVENRLRAEGDGFTIVMRALEAGRVTVAGKALGGARACFEDAVRYAKERTLRGEPIGRFQMIQSDIAEMAPRSRRVARSSTRRRTPWTTACRRTGSRRSRSSTRHRPPSCAPTRPCRSSAVTDSRRN